MQEKYEWVSISDRTRIIPEDIPTEIKFQSGKILDYEDENWPFELITHWRIKNPDAGTSGQ